MTVKELRAALEAMSDDANVFIATSTDWGPACFPVVGAFNDLGELLLADDSHNVPKTAVQLPAPAAPATV